MSRISATIRITIGLALLAVTALLAADGFGLVPDARRETIRGRAVLCESVAVHCSTLVGIGNIDAAESGLKALVDRNEDVLSAALRRQDGSTLVEVGQHAQNWQKLRDGRSTASQMLVPIYRGSRPWGTVEIRFEPIESAGWTDLLGHPLLRLVTFFAIGCFGVFFMYLRKMLQHLDPSKVIPDRVRAALDALAEGLVVVDQKERIVLANEAFAKRIGESSKKLQGRLLTRFEWSMDASNLEEQASHGFPWSRAIETGSPQLGEMLRLSSGSRELDLLVNASPVLGEKHSKARGALVTFEDVTPLKEKQAELTRMLQLLDASREEVRRHNKELQILATYDPLTQCMNRRSFFEQFESHWEKAQADGDDLAVIMIDIDHFKLFNDNHGHAFGDRVLKHVAGVVKDRLEAQQLACRFGGEEFCVLLPDATVEFAAEAAESLRQAIAVEEVDGARVTVSLGVSSRKLGAKTSEELLEQADKCLYVSKRSGRNRVSLWSEIPHDVEVDEQSAPRGESASVGDSISAQGLAALVATLNYRDPETADHSRRVADLAVAAAAVEGSLSLSEIRLMEVAALLHDIGKIGIPDAVLHKASPLSEVEWETMNSYGAIGVEIVNAAFGNDHLTRILQTYRAWFGGHPDDPAMPRGDEIPLPARLIALADAYDSMVSARAYRRGTSSEAAVSELKKCAGSQFDPRLVEIFSRAIECSYDESAEDQSALQTTPTAIGSAVERLAEACQRNDLTTVRALAGHLVKVARSSGADQIAETAGNLEGVLESEPELEKIFLLTDQMLELSRKHLLAPGVSEQA
ncbi:MAG: diguanylate cyclase [Pirellulaceae bacterium]